MSCTQRVPQHPQLARKASPELSRAASCPSSASCDGICGLKRSCSRSSRRLRALFALAEQVRQVYGLDVSETITQRVSLPSNFKLILSDGTSVPLPPESVDVAYSNQLMEHLHPDDALEQLEGIWCALRPGGVYICITPNGLSGPHDISAHFDSVATGFHLKEYTVAELSQLFRKVGFRKVQTLFGRQASAYPLPSLRLWQARRSCGCCHREPGEHWGARSAAHSSAFAWWARSSAPGRPDPNRERLLILQLLKRLPFLRNPGTRRVLRQIPGIRQVWHAAAKSRRMYYRFFGQRWLRGSWLRPRASVSSSARGASSISAGFRRNRTFSTSPSRHNGKNISRPIPLTRCWRNTSGSTLRRSKVSPRRRPATHI